MLKRRRTRRRGGPRRRWKKATRGRRAGSGGPFLLVLLLCAHRVSRIPLVVEGGRHQSSQCSAAHGAVIMPTGGYQGALMAPLITSASLLPLQLMLASVTVGAAQATNRLANGFSDCRCIDPFPVTGPGTNSTSCNGILRGAECYNVDYGARGCRAYDASSAADCQVDPPPAWCLTKWCYVADWNCRKPRHMSSFFPGVATANPAVLATTPPGAHSRLLTYSYETCGNVDLFTYETRAHTVQALPTATAPVHSPHCGACALCVLQVRDRADGSDHQHCGARPSSHSHPRRRAAVHYDRSERLLCRRHVQPRRQHRALRHGPL